MRGMRGKRLARAAALALTAVAVTATAWAQAPVPTPAPPPAPSAVPGVVPIPPPPLTPVAVEAVVPIPPPPVPCVGGYEPAGGAVRGAVRHVGRALQDGLIGYPELFNEPPLGYYLNNNLKTMVGNANPHRFTLYKTDFLAGSNLFSPTGATRFNLMANRLARWGGPIAVEWSPDEPGLAEARRASVVAALQRSGLPVAPDRVVMAPSPYPGGLGADGGNYYNVMIARDQAAPQSFSYSPSSASGFGAGGGGPR